MDRVATDRLYIGDGKIKLTLILFITFLEALITFTLQSGVISIMKRK